MATSVIVLWSSANFLCLFLPLVFANTHENVTSQPFNTTALDAYNVTDSYTTVQPVEPETTETTTSYSVTEAPVQPTVPGDPLPESGRLLTLAPNVDSLCPCDEHQNECDINCCCDRECGQEVALFTGCSVRTVRGNKQLCSSDVASYSLGTTADGYAELQTSVRKETNYDILCIQAQNRVNGFSHPSPALPTDSNFDSLFEQFNSFTFSSEENSDQLSASELQTSNGYQYGDEIVTAGDTGNRDVFWLPAPGVTADCVDKSPAAAFLKDQSGGCSRRLVLDQACSSLPALNMETYTNIQLFAGKNKDAVLVPVEVASVVLQSVDGTQTELTDGGGENLSPVLLNPDLCANVVLKVVYVLKYSSAGEIANVTVSLVLGFVRGAALPLKQEFHITFVQDVEDVAVHYSGNPGYVVGLPLVSGRTAAQGIVRSIELRETLSVLHSEDQDCLQGPHQRSPIMFGVNAVSGCTLRLEDAANCSLVSQVLLDVLRGPNYPQYVATFGNSPLNNPLDWVEIKSNINPGEAQSCSIPLSLHLEIEWTKYGSLVNPQAQIVSVREVIQTNTTSLELFSGSSRILPITTSVAFIPVSAAALPGFRAMPTINARLPFDFFFPFV